MEPDYNPFGFDGVWRMYLPGSKIRDHKTGEWVPEVLKDQVVEIHTDGDIMDYRIRVDQPGGTSLFMKYTCRFNDPEWTPYTVYHIDGNLNHPNFQPSEDKMLKQGTRLGEPIAFIKQVYVDSRTQYRITRNPDGSAQYAMLRRLSEDGNHNVATVLTPDGNAEISKHFIREAGPAPKWPAE